MRWKVEVYPADIERFRRECLDPILEQLCEWYHFIETCADPFTTKWAGRGQDGEPTTQSLHWRHPFGSMNWLDEGGSSDLDEYLASGSEVGLTRVDKLFTELI